MSRDEKVQIDAETLRTLHRIHRQRTDLQGQLRRGPLQLQAGINSIDQVKQQRDGIKDNIKKSKMNADQKQLQLRSREQRVEDLKVKLNQAASNKEYQLIKEQIAADTQANSVLADEILEILEQIDVLVSDLAVKENELKEAEAKQKKLEGEVQERMKSAQSDLDGVEKELAVVEQQLPASFRVEYQRIINTRGEEGLAAVEGDTCSGCYQTLTVQMINQMHLDQLVSCPNCGAFLYFPEDRRVR